jgi:hypothetical protein
MSRGAPKGNTNARREARRVPACLSISDEGPLKRRSWAACQLQRQGIVEPTEQEISRFVKDFCYAKIDEAIFEEQKNSSEKALTS